MRRRRRRPTAIGALRAEGFGFRRPIHRRRSARGARRRCAARPRDPPEESAARERERHRHLGDRSGRRRAIRCAHSECSLRLRVSFEPSGMRSAGLDAKHRDLRLASWPHAPRTLRGARAGDRIAPQGVPALGGSSTGHPPYAHLGGHGFAQVPRRISPTMFFSSPLDEDMVSRVEQDEDEERIAERAIEANGGVPQKVFPRLVAGCPGSHRRTRVAEPRRPPRRRRRFRVRSRARRRRRGRHLAEPARRPRRRGRHRQGLSPSSHPRTTTRASSTTSAAASRSLPLATESRESAQGVGRRPREPVEPGESWSCARWTSTTSGTVSTGTGRVRPRHRRATIGDALAEHPRRRRAAATIQPGGVRPLRPPARSSRASPRRSRRAARCAGSPLGSSRSRRRPARRARAGSGTDGGAQSCARTGRAKDRSRSGVRRRRGPPRRVARRSTDAEGVRDGFRGARGRYTRGGGGGVVEEADVGGGGRRHAGVHVSRVCVFNYRKSRDVGAASLVTWRTCPRGAKGGCPRRRC